MNRAGAAYAGNGDEVVAHVPDQHGHRHVRQGQGGAGVAKHDVTAPEACLIFQDFEDACAKRDAMVLLRLHAAARDHPQFLLEVELRPPGPEGLACPGGCKDRELQRAGRYGVRVAKGRYRMAARL